MADDAAFRDPTPAAPTPGRAEVAAAPAADPRHAPRTFPTTQWSEVARAADADPAVRRAALGRLVERYAPAFRAHLTRRRGLSPDDADDVLQGFACDQVVAAELLARADRARGRLRNYLLAAVDHYLLATWRHARAKKRAPEAGRVLSGDDAAAAADAMADGGRGAADVFDLEWARRVLYEAVARMRDECRRGPQPGHDRVWRLFELRVLRPIVDGRDPPGYADVVRAIGFESPTQASNALVSGKRMMARLLRAVVAEYAADPGEVEAEMNDLWAIVAGAGRAGGLDALLGPAADGAAPGLRPG